MARKRRFFFALWPDPRVREALIATRDRVADGDARLVRDGNLHLTLAFVGNIDAQLADALVAAGNVVHEAPFEVRLCEVAKRKSMLWLGPEGPVPALERLYESLWTAIEHGCGLERERRFFRAHVTLARKHPMPPKSREVDPLNWPVRSFALVESVQQGRTSVYRPVHVFSLTRN